MSTRTLSANVHARCTAFVHCPRKFATLGNSTLPCPSLSVCNTQNAAQLSGPMMRTVSSSWMILHGFSTLCVSVCWHSVSLLWHLCRASRMFSHSLFQFSLQFAASVRILFARFVCFSFLSIPRHVDFSNFRGAVHYLDAWNNRKNMLLIALLLVCSRRSNKNDLACAAGGPPSLLMCPLLGPSVMEARFSATLRLWSSRSMCSAVVSLIRIPCCLMCVRRTLGIGVAITGVTTGAPSGPPPRAAATFDGTPILVPSSQSTDGMF